MHLIFIAPLKYLRRLPHRTGAHTRVCIHYRLDDTSLSVFFHAVFFSLSRSYIYICSLGSIFIHFYCIASHNIVQEIGPMQVVITSPSWCYVLYSHIYTRRQELITRGANGRAVYKFFVYHDS